MNKMNFKQELYTVVNLNEYHARMAQKLRSMKALPENLFTRRTSVGSERLPETEEDYYKRASSSLLRLVESPCGVRKLSKAYSRVKRSRSKPPKVYPATRSVMKMYMSYLLELGLISKLEKKGYYTNANGKALMRELMYEQK